MSDTPRTSNSSQTQFQLARGKGDIKDAISMARSGKIASARALLIDILRDQPDNADVWFWLACVTENPWEALTSLKKVRELSPRYPASIEDGVRWAQNKIDAGERCVPMTAPFVPVETSGGDNLSIGSLSQRLRPAWALGAIVTLLLIGILGLGVWLFGFYESPSVWSAPPISTNEPARPTAPPAANDAAAWEVAWNNGDWGAAIPQLERLSTEHPTESIWRDRLFVAHVRFGEQLAANGRLEQAIAEYDAAMALHPYDTELQRARGLAARYAIGRERIQAADWAGAIKVLDGIWQENGNYRDTRKLLYTAHYNQGIIYQAAGMLDEAESEYLLALRVDDAAVDAENKLLEIQRLRTPPSPAKRIEVSIAEQRFYAYENDELVYDFVCSTGMYTSPTQPGSYEVLDKIPMAYASTWDLDMPYWLGIYWSGTLENGIHALPILSNGQLLWEGYLGQPASYGCIILSTEDAKTIYDWAEIGTPVIIY